MEVDQYVKEQKESMDVWLYDSNAIHSYNHTFKLTTFSAYNKSG